MNVWTLVAALVFVSSPVLAAKKSDFNWVRGIEGKDSYEFVNDPRAKELIASTAKTKCAGKDVVMEVTESLGGPAGKVTVEANRFASVDACRKHACHEISFVWVDTKESKAVSAFVSLLGGPIYVSTKDFDAKSLPKEFTASLNKWLSQVNWSKTRPDVQFCVSETKLEKIEPKN